MVVIAEALVRLACADLDADVDANVDCNVDADDNADAAEPSDEL